MQQETLESKIEKLQNKYYSENPRSFIFPFKHAQKMGCAQEIIRELDIDILCSRMAYKQSNAPYIYFDYTVFKTFAHPSIYKRVNEFMTHMIVDCVKEHGRVNIHVDLNTFTITAAQRYKGIIVDFCTQCLTGVAPCIETIYLHHSPKMLAAITSLFTGFIDDSIKHKIVMV